MCSKIFNDLFQELVSGTQFSIDSIADHCLAKELITNDTYMEILEEIDGSRKKARKLLVNVKANIEEGQNFERFIAILRNESYGGNLADKLEERYRALTRGK